MTVSDAEPARPLMEADEERARRIPLFGVGIDPLRMDELLARIDRLVSARRRTQYVDINAAKAVMLRDDARLAGIVRQCGIVVADGQGVVWASRLAGRPLPERLAGIDVMARLFRLAEERGYSIYLLGATQEVLERAELEIRRAHPRLRVAGSHHGYFKDEESRGLARAIRESEADLLVVGMPSPRKEYWLEENLEATGAVFAMGVGGSFDVVAGAVHRAPPWMRRAGLEWSYRLAQEPRRLWKRYLIGNVRFALLIARELFTGRPGE